MCSVDVKYRSKYVTFIQTDGSKKVNNKLPFLWFLCHTIAGVNIYLKWKILSSKHKLTLKEILTDPKGHLAYTIILTEIVSQNSDKICVNN